MKDSAATCKRTISPSFFKSPMFPPSRHGQLGGHSILAALLNLCLLALCSGQAAEPRDQLSARFRNVSAVEEVGRCYFFRLISRPGSDELMDAKLPCASRTVLKCSLVRPAIRLLASRTTSEVPPL